VITNNIYNEDDSDRLKKARLRLAEAQGILPLGSTSDLSKMNLLSFQLIPNLSKVREITWRVAEPEISYDPLKASSTLPQQPLTWLGRNIQIFVPITIFAFNILIDLLLHREEINRSKRAEQILNIISSQSPALIKAGQALSSRSDLLPKAYLDALQRLQDRCPPYPTYQAKALFESEMGQPFDDVFELESPEPVAAASIGPNALAACKYHWPTCCRSCSRPTTITCWASGRIRAKSYQCCVASQPWGTWFSMPASSQW
jgi:aarF domain-containing kinase